MKKILCVIAAAVMTVPAMMAQVKGDMYVGGNLGMNVGAASASTSVEGIKSKGKTPFLNEFTISPTFGYFVMDNWEVNTNLKYGVAGTQMDGTRHGNHKFSVGVGSNYYLSLCDRLDYTPGLNLDFGLQNNYSKVSSDSGSVRSSQTGFLFGIDFQLARLNFRINQHFALDLNVLGMRYELCSYSKNDYTNNSNKFTFGTGSLGLKYFF